MPYSTFDKWNVVRVEFTPDESPLVGGSDCESGPRASEWVEYNVTLPGSDGDTALNELRWEGRKVRSRISNGIDVPYVSKTTAIRTPYGIDVVVVLLRL